MARDAREQIERTQARGGGGIRRGLGPGGTRGTIELLCRGGGGIAALEVPSGGVQNTTFIPAFITRAPVFLGGSWGVYPDR